MLESKIFDFEECMYFVVDIYMYVKYIHIFENQHEFTACLYRNICFYSMYMYSVCIYMYGYFFSRYNSVDINVAVATDAGLITPIVSRADIKVGHSKEYIVL